MSEIKPGMIVVHSHRLEELTALVVSLTKTYPLAPLATESILVQSNGIAQWLKLHLAQAAGIAAMLDVTLPARFQWRAYRAVLGNELPTSSPFDKDRLTWRILRVLPKHLDEPEFEPLKIYIQDDESQRKLYQLSERLADLYDQYQIYRADWLEGWAEGATEPATEENYWQPKLWRYLLADVGNERWNNRASLHQDFIQKARQLTPATRPNSLPERVIIFGISSLPQQMLELLNALSSCMQVILCVHNPCAEHWSHIVDTKRMLAQEELHTQANPLLAAWGKQGRDYIKLLELTEESIAAREQLNYFSSQLFDHELPEEPSALQILQDDILHLRSIEESRASWSPQQPATSLQFHSAHSPQREVEILHDHLLAQFAQHPDLTPRDIMVMVPDIDAYAPHIDAVFGRLDRDDQRYIPYTIADQGSRHRHPILIALEYVVNIRSQRATASDILDLLQVSAIQNRFNISSANLAQLQRWIEQAGVRWALHEQHREALGLPGATGQNSWVFGLERILLGYATGQIDDLNSAWHGVEPYPDVAGLEAEAAGALLGLVQVLSQHFNALKQERTPVEWSSYLSELLQSLFLAESDSDTLLLNRLLQHLEQWLAATVEAGFDEAIPLTVVIESWLSRVDEQNLNQRFLAGSVNFATLMPMRAIPFKCVCLLGMNDGEYPRSQKPFDFDLMAHDYRPGDRSRREDDRYLFLEALLSARDMFYVSWQGHNARDNAEKPPSVLVSQLLEHLQRLWGEQQWIQEHRLQPFSEAYFSLDEPAHRELFTYAKEWHGVHIKSPTTEPASLRLPTWTAEIPLNVSQLTDFLREPARLLMNLRFNVYFPNTRLNDYDDELFNLDGLSQWQLLQPLFEGAYTQLSEHGEQQLPPYLDAALARMQRQGLLPMGAAGEQMKHSLKDYSLGLLDRAARLIKIYPSALGIQQVQLLSGSGLAVEQTFRGLRENTLGQRLWLSLTPSKLVNTTRSKLEPRPKHAVKAWVEHLLLNTLAPTETVVLGSVGALKFAAMTTEDANAAINQLLSFVEIGLLEPLPLELETALEGLLANHGTLASLCEADEVIAAHEAAATLYEEGSRISQPLVQTKRYVSRFYPTYSALTAGEHFDELARKLYMPMLNHLQLLAEEENSHE